VRKWERGNVGTGGPRFNGAPTRAHTFPHSHVPTFHSEIRTPLPDQREEDLAEALPARLAAQIVQLALGDEPAIVDQAMRRHILSISSSACVESRTALRRPPAYG